MEAYCVKCRKKVTISNPKKSKTKKGVTMHQGTCSICGTRVSKFGE